jgi:hypothetical protein
LKVRRGHERFIRRLETEFSADNKNYRGISSDLSISGMFIRTNHPFVPDTLIDIVIHLPDTGNVKLKGRVKHSIKTPIVSVKNGMGIQILQTDPRYVDFVKSVIPAAQAERDSGIAQPEIPLEAPDEQHPQSEPQPPEFSIISCPHCRVKNRVSEARLTPGTKCGRCGSPLSVQS